MFKKNKFRVRAMELYNGMWTTVESSYHKDKEGAKKRYNEVKQKNQTLDKNHFFIEIIELKKP
jgi:hypothetical protein